MAVELYPDFFNDVFGPIMQPGSSSHTAGPCRLGYVAYCLLGEQPRRVEVLLDSEGSFAGTFGTMHEDNGMLAGALGMLPDDVRLFDAGRIATEQGVDYAFRFTEMKESTHVNAVKFVLTAAGGKSATLVGDSTGGGMIETQRINGYPLRVRGDTYVLLVFDPDQRIAAEELESLRAQLPGLVGTGASKSDAGGLLHYFKTADAPDLDAARAVVAGAEIALLAPVLAVITRPERKPQLFDTMTAWREIAVRNGLPLWEVAVQYQRDASGWTREQVINYMQRLAQKMHRQTHAPYEGDVMIPENPFKPNFPAAWTQYSVAPKRLTGGLLADTIRWAYGAGAGIPGVETVAGPMGSGGGYIYAALCGVKDAHGFTDDDLLRGLFIAAGIGAIAFSRTEPTGEVLGCTGECGICGAMAAAAIAEMAGGTPAQVENAASLSLQSAIGIPCDPIPGGSGQPCRSRAMAAVCMAHVFADLALAEHDGVLALHEIIDVADRVGRQLPPELLCTSRGGACSAPTAQNRAAAYRAWFQRVQRKNLVRPPGNLI
jgi:L-serine dehydratase